MINFEVRLPGVEVPVMNGTTAHLPHKGDVISVSNVGLVVENLIWEFDHKYSSGALVTIVVSTSDPINITPKSKGR